MLTLAATVVCLLSAALTIFAGLRVFLHLTSWSNRLDEVETQIKSLRGKISATDRWTREEIEGAVDAYLERSGARESGGDDSLLAQMLPIMMSGGGFGQMMPRRPEPEPEPEYRSSLMGNGGVDRNGEAS